MTALNIESVKITTIKFDPDNARSHGPRNIAAIRASLDKFGQRRPLVVFGETVIAGNGTLQAAKELGWEEISITRVPDDWTKEQAQAFALTDNRTSELAEWNGEQLLKTLQEIDTDLIASTGFNDKELADLTKLWGGAPDLDDLYNDIGTPTDEDGLTRVSFSVPPEVAAKWEMTVKKAGSGSYLENLCTAIQAAYDSVVEDIG
jgi:hypothetical protein